MARWIPDPYKICDDTCSSCGLPSYRNAGEELPDVCPNCGATMTDNVDFTFEELEYYFKESEEE